jgi:5-hydroxyisourate hydrolase-like protein (transthyretin family)
MLDTSLGRPAAGVPVQLHRRCPGSGQAWQLVARGVTNRDGRVGDLLPPSNTIEPGVYRCAVQKRFTHVSMLVKMVALVAATFKKSHLTHPVQQ